MYCCGWINFDINHVFPPKMPSFILLVDIWFRVEWREDRAMGKQESAKWPPTHELHPEIMIKTFYKHSFTLLIINIWCGWEKYFLSIVTGTSSLKWDSEKWHSSEENRLDCFLCSPHVWPFNLLFTSHKPSKSPRLFLSDTENNSDPSTSLYPGWQLNAGNQFMDCVTNKCLNLT